MTGGHMQTTKQLETIRLGTIGLEVTRVEIEGSMR